MSELKGIIESLAIGLREEGSVAVTSLSPDRPHIVALNRKFGLVAIYVQNPWNNETIEDANQSLNTRLYSYRGLLDEQFHSKLSRYIFEASKLPAAATGSPKRVNKITGTWQSLVPKKPVNADDYEALRNFLQPSDLFVPRMHNVEADVSRESRLEQRYALDSIQSQLGMERVRDVMVVTGPAGSGKTLVLASRAMRLAAEHPEWKIQFLCFNHGLVPYLEHLVQGFGNISVEQFGKFVETHGYKFTMGASADVRSMDEYRRASEKGIEVGIFDALLIDEMQDFAPGWIQFALDGLFPGRGGAVLAGDPQQSIYREVDPEVALAGHSVVYKKLTKPYRSTKQILNVIATLDPDLEVEGWEDAPDGPQPEVVYSSSVAAAARAIAHDIKNWITEGIPAGQIGVLCISKYALGPIAGRLREEGIPAQVVWQPRTDPLSMTEDSVKVITVNHAKGIDFDAVCIYGLDEIRDPDQADLTPSEKVERRLFERNNLVGPSRAKDRLTIYYKKPNKYVDRLVTATDVVKAWTYPDDYPGAT